MQFLGHLIVRLVGILAGLAFAFVCCGIFIGIGFFEQFVDTRLADDPRLSGRMFALFIGLAWSPVVAAAAFGPALALVAIAEIMRWRGLIANALLGAVAAFVSFWLAVAQHHEPRGLHQGTVIALLATGFVGGLAYWLVAGRSAGRWLDPPNARPGGPSSAT